MFLSKSFGISVKNVYVNLCNIIPLCKSITSKYRPHKHNKQTLHDRCFLFSTTCFGHTYWPSSGIKMQVYVSRNTCERQDSTGDGAERWRFYLNAVKHMDWRAFFHIGGVSDNLSLITGFFSLLEAVTDILTNCRPVYLVLLVWWNQGWRTQHTSEKRLMHTFPDVDVSGELLDRARMVCSSVNGLLLMRRTRCLTERSLLLWRKPSMPSLWAGLLPT